MARTQPAHRKRRGAWKPDFLKALGEHGMVTTACQEAGVGRRTAYDARDADPDFAQAWADIEEVTTERMEREAYRRAVKGVQRDVFYKGDVVGQEQHYSDTLLIFMLKARRPQVYRDNVRVQHTGFIRTEPPELVETEARLEAIALLAAGYGALGAGDEEDVGANGYGANGHP